MIKVFWLFLFLNVILLLAVPRRLFCFGSLVVLDVVFRYLSLCWSYINTKIGKIDALLLAVPRRLFCFGSLVVLDVVFRYLSLCLLYINTKIGKNRCFIAGRPKATLLFWLFGGFRCGVPLFIVMLVIY